MSIPLGDFPILLSYRVPFAKAACGSNSTIFQSQSFLRETIDEFSGFPTRDPSQIQWRFLDDERRRLKVNFH